MDSSDLRSRWERLTGDTTFRVATLLAGASWFIVEAADTLGAGTALIRGLALALALLFALVVPVVWSIARRRADASPSADTASPSADAASPRLPFRGHRPWAIAIVVVLVLGSGAWWLGASRPGSVPVEAKRLAVLPFHVTGSESVRDLGTGMVDLLSAGMNDVAGIQTVSGRAVLARMGGVGGRGDGGGGGNGVGSSVPLERALEVGRELGAGSVLTGSVTAVGGQVRLTAQVRPVDGGDALATAEVQGAEEELLSLVDRLAVRLLGAMWQSADPLPSVRMAALTTTSPAALRAYLRGERQLRAMADEEAAASFREAVEADSTFSLAWLRLAEAIGWGGEAASRTEQQRSMERALAHADRLPAREAALVRAAALEHDGDLAALDSLDVYVARYPDDPYGWYLLGDARYHAARLGLHAPDEIVQPFLRAARLDPQFAVGLSHAVDMALVYGDRTQYDSLMTLYAHAAAPERVAQARLEARLRWAPADSVVAVFLDGVRSLAEEADLSRLNGLVGTLGNRTRLDLDADPLDYASGLDAAGALVPGHAVWSARTEMLATTNFLALGRTREAYRQLDESLARHPGWGPPFPQPLQAPLLRVAWSLTHGGDPDVLAADVARLEEVAPEHPAISDLLHFYYLEHGDTERADRFSMIPPPPEAGEDTTALRLALEGYDRLVRGDTVAGLAHIAEAIESIGYLDVGFIDHAIFPYAVALTRDPLTRDRGLRMLRWATAYRAVEPGSAYLELARGLDDAGRQAEAREAYAHVVRIWEGADAFRQPQVAEARAALARLTREGPRR